MASEPVQQPAPRGPGWEAFAQHEKIVALSAMLRMIMLATLAAATGALGACVPARAVSEPEPFRVAVISDLNGAYGSVEYGAEVGRGVELALSRWRADLVLAAGDLVAGQRPTLEDGRVRDMWAAFDSVVARPLRTAGVPFGFALGNHDASAYPAHERDRRLAVEHWRAPARHPGVSFVDSTAFPLYYSMRQGPLFIVAWDATWEGTLSDTSMIAWLGEQLRSDAARHAPFRVILGHLPLYAVAEGRNRPGEVLAHADSLRALMESWDVHLYISGHHHAYYPGVSGALELLHAGALGDGPRPLIGTTEPSPRTVTLLDFDARSGSVTWTTYALEDGAEPRVVQASGLPAYIDGFNGRVERRSGAGRRSPPAAQ